MSNYWLLKSEPSTFSIEDLAYSPHQTTSWEGVRNYQARNFMKIMALGDRALWSNSRAAPPAIAGMVEVVKTAYPDHFAWQKNHKYFDANSSRQNPRWVMVDVRLLEIFRAPIPLERLRGIKELDDMALLKKGSRLSIQPVREKEWNIIMQLARETR